MLHCLSAWRRAECDTSCCQRIGVLLTLLHAKQFPLQQPSLLCYVFAALLAEFWLDSRE